MNVQAHLNGQMPNQVPNQGGQQIPALPQHHGVMANQMHSMASLGVEADWETLRSRMQMKIYHYLQSNPLSNDWKVRLPEISKRFEELIYKECHNNKDEYFMQLMGDVSRRLNLLLKNRHQAHQNNNNQLHNSNQQHSSQSSAHFISSSSNYSTMIPTPGMSRNSRGMIEDSLAGSSSSGMIPNGYQHSSINVVPNSGSTSTVASAMPSMGVRHQVPQMIPTPGFNNQQTLSTSMGQNHNFNRESSSEQNVSGSNQQHLGGHSGNEMQQMVQQRPSPYGLSDGVMNGGSGLLGTNMQPVSGHAAAEGYSSMHAFGTSLRPQLYPFNQQLPQQRIATSLSQQVLPIAADGKLAKSSDVAGSGNLYSSGPSAITAVNTMNMNPGAAFQSKPRMNPSFGSQLSNVQPVRSHPNLKSQMLDQQENMQFQSPQTSHELLQSQLMKHRMVPTQQLTPNQQHQLMRSNAVGRSLLCSSVNEQVMSENVIVTNNHLGSSLIPNQVQFPDYQIRFQNKDGFSDGNGNSVLVQLPESQNFRSSVSSSEISQLPQQFQNEVNAFSRGSNLDQNVQSQWGVQMMHTSQVIDNASLEKQVQAVSQEELQQPIVSLEGQIAGASVVNQIVSVVPKLPNGNAKYTPEEQILAVVKSVLLLRHAHSCQALPGKCPISSCSAFRELARHIDICDRADCSYKNCLVSKKFLYHIRHCKDEKCCLCSRAKSRFVLKRNPSARTTEPSTNGEQNVPQKASDGNIDRMETERPSAEASEDGLPSQKRMRHTFSSCPPETDTISVSIPPNPYLLPEDRSQAFNQNDVAIPENMEIDASINPIIQSTTEKSVFLNYSENGNVLSLKDEVDVTVPVSKEVSRHVKQEVVSAQKEIAEKVVPVEQEKGNVQADPSVAAKSGKPKIKGVSMMELFTPEQIRNHIHSLRQWVGQSKAKAERNQAMENTMSENSCQLCAVEKLTFEPPPIYCSPCGARIKKNAMYYTAGSGDSRLYFCILCYNEARGETIVAEGSQYQKSKLEKKKNDEETEEWWVQCDKCEAWQHQICALFNGRRNDGEAEYTCPYCYLKEIERGERTPLPESAVLGAKDLPRTILSDHIEQRLAKRLRLERQERANHAGKPIDEVPAVEGLVVRVVSSVDKRLDVKPRFLEIFQEENYPTEFPYKSKAVLLFQRIEGVEVCLFGMYVQEFGSECLFPNQRRVYLSYLDSVKYFRPEIKTVHGEALRTFVYHEILIGYLEYCKKRGFTSCYIWACPPLKGEDYILYCHPEIQKTPKSDKLREWYLSMLRKATKESIVVDLTNLYDHFFMKTGECKAKVTAARLPYFDGDYWPGAAEDMISQLNKEEEEEKKQPKKVRPKKIITKRTLKAAGHMDPSGSVSKDLMLMRKLGETIYPMKEDFIMVHLQHACSYCCILIASGTRWACNQCKHFQLCDRCHDSEQRSAEAERHGATSREKHVLYPHEITDVPEDTKDKDDILESEFFDTRQAFLSLCQGNHYQYDTLRRAKHSSMMVLYHLHNPTAPAFVSTCYMCHLDIEAGQGWRCEVCDFDVCNPCYQKDGGVNHPHKLTDNPSLTDRDAQNKEARQQRVLQLRKMLDLLIHASLCRVAHCTYPNCRKVKGLFRHGMQCKTRVSGGCVLCKKMWYLLQLHARACKEPQCTVPRCRDLKDHLRRLQQQSDSRRRAAVMEMMRQRAAEVSSSNG